MASTQMSSTRNSPVKTFQSWIVEMGNKPRVGKTQFEQLYKASKFAPKDAAKLPRCVKYAYHQYYLVTNEKKAVASAKALGKKTVLSLASSAKRVPEVVKTSKPLTYAEITKNNNLNVIKKPVPKMAASLLSQHMVPKVVHQDVESKLRVAQDRIERLTASEKRAQKAASHWQKMFGELNAAHKKLLAASSEKAPAQPPKPTPVVAKVAEVPPVTKTQKKKEKKAAKQKQTTVALAETVTEKKVEPSSSTKPLEAKAEVTSAVKKFKDLTAEEAKAAGFWTSSFVVEESNVWAFGNYYAGNDHVFVLRADPSWQSGSHSFNDIKWVDLTVRKVRPSNGTFTLIESPYVTIGRFSKQGRLVTASKLADASGYDLVKIKSALLKKGGLPDSEPSNSFTVGVNQYVRF